MENETFPHLLAEDDIGLVIDANETATLEDTMKWSRFFVIGMVVASAFFLLLVLLIGGADMRLLPRRINGALVFMYISYGVLAVLMLVFLMRFCIFCRKAIDSEDLETFNQSLAALKNYFITSGIAGMLYLFFMLIQYAAG